MLNAAVCASIVERYIATPYTAAAAKAPAASAAMKRQSMEVKSWKCITTWSIMKYTRMKGENRAADAATASATAPTSSPRLRPASSMRRARPCLRLGRADGMLAAGASLGVCAAGAVSLPEPPAAGAGGDAAALS